MSCNTDTYFINSYYCLGCGHCADVCPMCTVYNYDGIYYIEESECIACGECYKDCPYGAVVGPDSPWWMCY